MTKNIPNFYSGISGLQLPVPKYLYPPAFQSASRLTYYASFFNSIEINSSFYKIPMKATVARWAETVPDHFKFTFKLYKEITHAKNLNFEATHVDQFIDTISCIGLKKGCLLVQFPPSVKKDKLPHLDRLLHAIKIADPSRQWRIAVEFRDKGWYSEDVYQLLNVYQASLVIQDIPASATPFITTLSTHIYVRFHGPTGNYRGNYTDAFLYEYAEYIQEWLSQGKTVFVYFNNTMGEAFQNLTTLNKYVA